MGWLDNVIAFISPERGARRLAWRSAFEELRNYDAGDGSRMNAGWRVSNYSAEMTDRGSREYVRARARDLERNSDIMNSLIWARKRNVIGSGFHLQSKTGNEELNTELERLWKKWCKARNCDVTGTQSLNQMLRMAVVRKHVDGGILFVKRYTKDGMVPFALQMVEVDELDTMHTVPGDARHRVVGGIEYNEYNRPAGYWIRQYQIDGFSIAEPVYIKADDVIFYYSKRRPSQIREMSDMAHTITRIRDTNEFMTAVSVKERIEACLAVFIKKALPVTGVGRPGMQSAEKKIDYDGKRLAPGMIQELNTGDEVYTVNPSGQSADAASFVKLHQKMVGAGQGLSYESTSRDLSETNYSSARQGAIEDELAFVEEEEQIIAILDEIYETFVISCVLAGLVSIPGFWSNKEEFFLHEWIKMPKKWIDPLKEANATKVALNSGIKSYKQVAAENGMDWREQIDDMAEVLEYASEKGIGLGGVLFDGKLKEEKEGPGGQGNNGGDADASSGDGKDGSTDTGQG
ncbi:MAG: phage portal protein [Lachnospiraceae bacterium]